MEQNYRIDYNMIEENGIFSTQINNDPMDYNAIMKRIERILNPFPGEIRSDEILANFSMLKEMFTKNYEEMNNKTEQYQTSQQNSSEIMKAKLST